MKCSWTKHIAVVMAAVSLCLLPAYANAQKGGPRPPRVKLNLSDDQQQKLRAHIKDSEAKTRNARRDVSDARSDLRAMFAQYDLNKRDVDSAIQKVGATELKLMNIHLSNQIALRSILTMDQFDQLRIAVGGRGKFRGEPGMEMDGPGPNATTKQLDLSDDQQQKIRKLWTSSRDKMSKLRDKSSDEHDALDQVYLQYDLDTKAARQHIKAINGIQMSVLRETASRQFALRRILNKDQFAAIANAAGADRFSRPRRWERRP